MEKPVVSGIEFSRDEAKLTVRRVKDVPGVASKLLGPIGAGNVDVDVIVQNVSEHGTTDFTFTVSRNDLPKAALLLRDAVSAEEFGNPEIITDEKVAKVSVVGVGMRSHAGVANTMFEALAEENINIEMITTSEIKISVIIEEKHLDLAVAALHRAFGLEQE